LAEADTTTEAVRATEKSFLALESAVFSSWSEKEREQGAKFLFPLIRAKTDCGMKYRVLRTRQPFNT
jgi:hypothetical protein